MTPPRSRSPLRARVVLALVVTLLVALDATTLAQERPIEPLVFEIGRELRCPTCVAESVGESNAAIAREMRVLIQEQLDQGASRSEVLAYFQERYGDWILLNPPMRGMNLVVWLLPLVAAALGLLVLVRLLKRWRGAAEEPVDVDPAELERVRAELQGQLGEGASR